MVVYLDTQPKHRRDRFRRKAKNKLKKEAEDEVVYLDTRPWHLRDRFRDRVKERKIAQIIKQGKNLYKWFIKDEGSVFYATDIALW